jgi:DNA-binding LacI/PurR family transcriptional regulator
VTVAEIAKQLELGTSTVAHVLNGRGAELRIRLKRSSEYSIRRVTWVIA